MKTKYEWADEFERRRKEFGCEPNITDFVMDVQDDARQSGCFILLKNGKLYGLFDDRDQAISWCHEKGYDNFSTHDLHPHRIKQ